MKRLLLLYAVSTLGACTREPRAAGPGPGASATARGAAPPPVVISPDAARPPGPRADSIAWRDVPEGRFDPPDLVIAGPGADHYQWKATRPDGPAAVSRLDPQGQPRWTTAVPSDFVPGAALVAADDRVILVHHSIISSGATAVALDAATGRILWTTDLQALGPVAHSEYLNHVAVELQGGAIVVFGAEAAGRYIEVVDLDGRTTSNHRPPSP